MSKTKVSIIVCYFGKFPNYMDLFIRSCSFNNDYNWLIFTDNRQTSEILIPNITFIYLEFSDFQKLIKKRINKKCICPAPYKICDYRPAFGLLFSDFLQDSEYWGFCDLDMLFGDLNKYLAKPIKEKYDKIYNHGHLTLMRNITEVNEAFMLPFSSIEYKYVFSHKDSFGFDEKRGINQIFKEYKFHTFTEDTFADIYPPFVSVPLKQINRENHPNQSFIWEEGKVYRIINDTKEFDEYSYIHLQKRPFIKHNTDLLTCKSFYINPFSFGKRDMNYLYPDLKRKMNHSRMKNIYSSVIYKYHLIINWILYNKRPARRIY